MNKFDYILFKEPEYIPEVVYVSVAQNFKEKGYAFHPDTEQWFYRDHFEVWKRCHPDLVPKTLQVKILLYL